MRGGREKLWSKLSSAFLRKWWFVVATSVAIIIIGVLFAIFFLKWVNIVLHHEIVLRPGSQTFDLWAKPPVTPVYKVYVFNVTNADEFLSNGSKPIVDEIGPYVYVEKWEKKNLRFHENGTITFNQEKIYVFDEEQSVGSEDDVVVVPNIPMLVGITVNIANHVTKIKHYQLAAFQTIRQRKTNPIIASNQNKSRHPIKSKQIPPSHQIKTNPAIPSNQNKSRHPIKFRQI